MANYTDLVLPLIARIKSLQLLEFAEDIHRAAAKIVIGRGVVSGNSGLIGYDYSSLMGIVMVIFATNVRPNSGSPLPFLTSS